MLEQQDVQASPRQIAPKRTAPDPAAYDDGSATHFEQIYGRAVAASANALATLDFATKAGRILDLYSRQWQGQPLASRLGVLGCAALS